MNPLPLVAVAGSPNAGKSALFNALTGARQKVGNYPGVTVERHSGRFALDDGRPIELVDLPGAYSLDPASPDERVTRDVLTGAQAGERLPDALVVVVDAANLDNHLRFTLQLIALGLPLAFLPAEQHIAGDRFIRACGIEAVGAGQVDHLDRPPIGQNEPTGLPLDRHAGIIADFLPGAGQRVEQRALAGIGIAGDGNERKRIHWVSGVT